jgi:mannitol-1-phosphate/altronate dehydrogenase
MVNGTRARMAIVAYLEGARQLAEELNDENIEYLIERALLQARRSQVNTVERSAVTMH